ncbi:MAG: 3-deoxy-D-manno-octulosonic acid transferase, partial [Zoogloea sp.]|nr:3-deoxy-D-manno-octulosonic acid transferase [Zoogloea sp.]
MPTFLARLLYSAAWHLAAPLVLARLAWRARRQPAYLQNTGERLGLYAHRPDGPVIWLHAVSVGETRAAEPLVRALLARHPGHSLVLTHMTPTGRATGLALFASLHPRVTSVYLPYDVRWAVRRFLRHFRPAFGILMETELWPNLVATCRQQGVPLAMVNARLSSRSARGYARAGGLAREAFGGLAVVGAQTEADAERLRSLGARSVSVTGNMKFDITPPERLIALGAQFRAGFGGRPVLLAASTREGEEVELLAAFARLAAPEVLLVLVPRHPQRFDDVALLAAQQGLAPQRRSADEMLRADTRVWLGDSMGEMFAYYAAADAALIGGSWQPLGGQNLIEACAVGCPVIVGPHTFNFSAATTPASMASV